MRRGDITYWRCPDCLGTGKLAPHWSNHVEDCRRCDATGNALVDGRQRDHEREIERRTADAMRRRAGNLDPNVWATPTLWPHDAESHAADLARQETELARARAAGAAI